MASTSRGAILQGLEGGGGRPRRKFGVANRNSSDGVAIRKSDVMCLQALTLVSNKMECCDKKLEGGNDGSGGERIAGGL